MLDKENVILTNKKISEHLPIACHFDSNTLVTKNGDLMQTIEITGFEPNDDNFNKTSLRDTLRGAIAKHILHDKIALHIHTLNNFTSIKSDAQFPSAFAQSVHQRWCEYNSLDHQLMTKLYVTIIVQGPKHSPFDPNKLHRILLTYFYKKDHINELIELQNILTTTTDNIIKEIARFGPRILGITLNKNGQYISELLSFFYNLSHHRTGEVPVEHYDASQQIGDLEIDYFFNKISLREIQSERRQGKAVYTAVFTIKSFHELDVQDCIKVLEHRYKYIISETIVFVPKSVAVKKFKRSAEFLEAGKSEDIAQAIRMDEIMSGNNGQTDYCQRQINVALICDTPEELDQSAEKMLKVFAHIGITAVREDFAMPMCFWSVIPGNFRYNNRHSYALTKFASTFAFVPNMSMGSYNGSKWGEHVVLFQNRQGLPYYFNFHHNHRGTTMIVGPEGGGKETLLRFLLANATKLNPKIIFFDLRGNNEKFFSLIGGQTVSLSDDGQTPFFKINFSDLAKNIDYAKGIFSYLFFDTVDFGSLEQGFIDGLVKALADNKELIGSVNELSAGIHNTEIRLNIEEINDKLLKPFHGTDDLSVITNARIINIDLSKFRKSWGIVLLRLLLDKMPGILDNSPTIIAVNSDFRIFEQRISIDKLVEDIEAFHQHNVVPIFTFDYNKKLYENFQFIEKIIDRISTQIFLSNKMADKSFKKTFKLSDQDFFAIKNFDHGKRSFLLKQHESSANIIFDLDFLKSLKEDFC